MRGPRLSDEEFFGKLKLEDPALAEVKGRLAAQDVRGAKAALAAHFRRREKPRWFLDPRAAATEPAPPEAERYLRREVQSVGVWHKFEGEIDWFIDPVDYREFPWQLNRHHHWVQMAKAYRATGNEDYAKEFVLQLHSWIEQCPVSLKVWDETWDAWRSIEAGIRMGWTWMDAFLSFLPSPYFDDDSVCLMLKSFCEHAEYLMPFESRNNWLTMEASGLFAVGVMFPEFKAAPVWFQTALSRLYKHLDAQVYPDGAQMELTTSYHCVSLGNFLRPWKLAKLNGIVLPPDYLGKLQRMYDFLLYMTMPDGNVPGVNDADDFAVSPILQEGHTLFPARSDLLYVATGGRSGERPEHLSYQFPYAGYYVMRSGWHAADKYLLFDGGPFGLSHQHEDKLSFVVYAGGRTLIHDPGNYAYDTSVWRRHFISSYAHNVVLVDGQGQNRRARPDTHVTDAPLENRWISELSYDYAEAAYREGFGDSNAVSVVHVRKILFVKPDFWIVLDLLAAPEGDEHTYEALFHISSENLKADGSVWSCDPGTTNVQILPLVPVEIELISGRTVPYYLGWGKAGERRTRPVPVAVLRKKAVGPTCLAYAIVPLEAGEPPKKPDIEAIHLREDGAVLVVRMGFPDGSRSYFVHSKLASVADTEEHVTTSIVLNCGEFTTDAELAFVELNPSGKALRGILLSGEINWV